MILLRIAIAGRTFHVSLHECWVPDFLIIPVAPRRLSNSDREVAFHEIRCRLSVCHAPLLRACGCRQNSADCPGAGAFEPGVGRRANGDPQRPSHRAYRLKISCHADPYPTLVQCWRDALRCKDNGMVLLLPMLMSKKAPCLVATQLWIADRFCCSSTLRSAAVSDTEAKNFDA